MAFVETIISVAKESGKATVERIKQDADKVKNLSPEDIGELAKKEIENVKESGATVIDKLKDIQGMTPEQLMEKMHDNLENLQKKTDGDGEGTENTEETDEGKEGLKDEEKTKIKEETDEVKEGLKDEEKAKIKEETGWSDEIIDAIGSMAEYEIYKKAGLVEAEIGGKKCLIRQDIDWDKKWETGKYDENGNPIYETNRERIAKGKAPLDSSGNPIQLHHIGQHADSPLAELTFEEHRCGGNDKILHDKPGASETHGEGNTWDKERQDYWKNRSEYNNGGADNG